MQNVGDGLMSELSKENQEWMVDNFRHTKGVGSRYLEYCAYRKVLEMQVELEESQQENNEL